MSRPPVLAVVPTATGQDQGEPTAAPVWRTLEPAELLRLLATTSANVQVFANLDGVVSALATAQAQHAIALAQRADALAALADELGHGTSPRLHVWERVSALRDRPFHPVARAKDGWCNDDYQRYTAESGEPLGVCWLAVRRDYVRCSSVATACDAAALLLGSEQDRASLGELYTASLALRDPDRFVVLPVHPWQMERVIRSGFEHVLASGALVPLTGPLGRFVATASVRTLAPVQGGALHLKLPLSIVSLGALRTLPWRQLHNGAHGQALLEAARARHPVLARRLHLCDEQRWWAYWPPGADHLPDDQAQLGCLLREYPDHLLRDPAVMLVPLSALAVAAPHHREPAQAPAAMAILGHGHDPARAHADDALALFRDICDRLVEVALACFGLGLMPELHGQNVLLVIRHGRVEGLVLRDHDTVRIHPPWMRAMGLVEPAYAIDSSTPNSLVLDHPERLLSYFQTLGLQVSLRAIAHTLAHAWRLPMAALWQVLAQAVAGATGALALPGPAAKVVDRQLLGADTWPTRRVLLPLLQRTSVASASMPSSTGLAPNPLRALASRGEAK